MTGWLSMVSRIIEGVRRRKRGVGIGLFTVLLLSVGLLAVWAKSGLSLATLAADPTVTPTSTATPAPTYTPEPTATPTPTPTPTPVPTATPTPIINHLRVVVDRAYCGAPTPYPRLVLTNLYPKANGAIHAFRAWIKVYDANGKVYNQYYKDLYSAGTDYQYFNYEYPLGNSFSVAITTEWIDFSYLESPGHWEGTITHC